MKADDEIELLKKKNKKLLKRIKTLEWHAVHQIEVRPKDFAYIMSTIEELKKRVEDLEVNSATLSSVAPDITQH